MVLGVNQLRAEVDRLPHGLLGVVGLDVEMHPRRSVDLLEVEVGPAERWLEAPQLGMVPPRAPVGHPKAADQNSAVGPSWSAGTSITACSQAMSSG